jgi:hypothetical protein
LPENPALISARDAAPHNPSTVEGAASAEVTCYPEVDQRPMRTNLTATQSVLEAERFFLREHHQFCLTPAFSGAPRGATLAPYQQAA